MSRKIWIVAVVALAGVALTPDTAEAGKRRRQKKQQTQPALVAPTPMPMAPVVTPPTPAPPVVAPTAQ